MNALEEQDEDELKQTQSEWHTARYKLIVLIKKIQKEVFELQNNLKEWETRKGNLLFELERERSKGLGKLWILFLLSLIVFMFYSFSVQNYVLCAANGIAFLMNWRMLYVKHSEYAITAGLVVLGLSVAFLK